MAFGLGVLRLSQEDFWKMTPRELLSAAEGVYGRPLASPRRDALEGLMRDYPDRGCNE
jgi:uncharacterized phage protein (TIGR02216 family)